MSVIEIRLSCSGRLHRGEDRLLAVRAASKIPQTRSLDRLLDANKHKGEMSCSEEQLSVLAVCDSKNEHVPANQKGYTAKRPQYFVVVIPRPSGVQDHVDNG